MTSFVPSPAALHQFKAASSTPDSDTDLKYGMSMWFRVSLRDGMNTTGMGAWSSCGGLGVDITTEPVPNGIGPDSPSFAPMAVTYKPVTLERAMSTSDSTRVRAWLERVVADWVLADEGMRYPGVTVVIELFSALRPLGIGQMNLPVASWHLRNAYPVSWSGPSLAAGTGGIATEKLTLAHGGFLKLGGEPSSRTTGSRTGESGLMHLSCATGDKKALRMQYQPAEISMDQSFNSKSGSSKTEIAKPDKISFTITVRMEGAQAVKEARDLLYTWLVPTDDNKSSTDKDTADKDTVEKSTVAKSTVATSTAGKDIVDTREEKALKLRIGNGPGKVEYDVYLHSVKTVFKRFTAQGDPCRATFGLTFGEKPPTTGVSKATPDGKPAALGAVPTSDPTRAAATQNGTSDMLRTGRV